ISDQFHLGWRAAHDRKRLAGAKPKLCIETKGLIVVCGLRQPHAWEFSLFGTRQYILHQGTTKALPLNNRVNRNRSNSGNLRAFIKKITADNAPVEFRHDRIEFRMS